ncbi:MAG: lipocalin family protein [Gemmatimonadales bacterium]|nr:lipocalin family protein [Gemmatimonadales bacterium]
MRKLNLTKALLALWILGLVFTAAGCGDDDPESSLEGSWRFSSWTVDGLSVPASEWYEDGAARVEVTLNANGTWSANDFDADGQVIDSDGGTYTATAENLTLLGDGDELIFIWSITGDTLSLSMTEDGHLAVLSWTRL